MSAGISYTIGVLVRGHNALTSALVQAEGSLASFRKVAEASAARINRAFTPPDVDLSTFQEASGHLTNAGTAALVAGGAIAAGLGGAVHAALGFRSAMAEVATLVDTGVVDVEALGAGVKALSSEFGQAPVETAKALYTTISAGFMDANDASVLLRGALKLARGGVADLNVSIDGLTSVLNSYGLKAADTAHVSDLMFVAMKAGKTTIGELSSTLGRVTPLASAAGVGLDQLLAATSALTLGGLNTAEAVTAMRGILSSVIKPTAEAEKLAKSLGIAFDVSALRSQGLAAWMNELAQKTGGSQSALSVLFGQVEALSGVLALTGSQAGSFASILEQMGHASGATEEAFRKVDATAEAAFGRLKANATVLLVTIGDALLPVLSGAANAVSLVAGKFAAFADAHPLLSQITFTLAGVSAALLVIGGTGLVVAGQIVSAMALVNVSTGGLLLAFGAVATGITALAVYFTGSSERMAKASTLLGRVWEDLRAAFYAVATPIAFGLGFLVGTVEQAWGRVRDETLLVWPLVAKVAGDAWDVITALVSPATAVIVGAVTFAWNALVTLSHVAWDTVALTVRTAWTLITSTISLAWNVVFGFLHAGLLALTGDWRGAMDALGIAAVQAWDHVKAIFGAAAGFLTGLGGIFYDAGAGLMDALLRGVLAGWEHVHAGMTWVVEGIRALLPGSDAQDGPLSELSAAGRALLPTFARGIAENGKAPVTIVRRSVAPVVEQLRQTPVVERPSHDGPRTLAARAIGTPTMPPLRAFAPSPAALEPREAAARTRPSDVGETATSSRVTFERGAFHIEVHGAQALDDLEDRLTDIFRRAALRAGAAHA